MIQELKIRNFIFHESIAFSFFIALHLPAQHSLISPAGRCPVRACRFPCYFFIFCLFATSFFCERLPPETPMQIMTEKIIGLHSDKNRNAP